MPRPHRRAAESGIHHVMNRGVDHQAVFFADCDRLEFGRGLAVAYEEHGVSTLAYCLMGNHYHLLLRCPQGSLSTAMHQLTSTYSHRVNDRLGRDGPLFRGRFHSIPVETDSYLIWAARYIHRNPLDLPGVQRLQDHRWSSYRTYLGLRPVAPFLDLQPLLDLVGGPHRLVAFTEDMPPRLEAQDVHRLIEWAVAIDDVAHPSSEARRAQLTRTVMILVAARTTDHEIERRIDTALGERTVKAKRTALMRAETRLALDPPTRRCLDLVASHLVPGTKWD